MTTLQLLSNGTCFPKESFQYKMQGIFFLKKIKLNHMCLARGYSGMYQKLAVPIHLFV